MSSSNNQLPKMLHILFLQPNWEAGIRQIFAILREIRDYKKLTNFGLQASEALENPSHMQIFERVRYWQPISSDHGGMVSWQFTLSFTYWLYKTWAFS